jgi:hypothetical protein
MKPTIFLVLLFPLLTPVSEAQCPQDPNTVAGGWKEVSDYYNPPFNYRANSARFDRAGAGKILEEVLELTKRAYPNPTGCNANYDMRFPFANFHRDLPFGYFLRVGFFNFSCEGNTPKEIDSTNVWLTVEVNSLTNSRFLSVVSPPQAGPSDSDERFNADEDGNYTVAGKTVYAIPHVKDERRGVEYFAAEDYGEERGGPGIQYFIIRKDGIPLFLPVSRRDYLLQFRQELAGYRQAELNRLNNWQAAVPEDQSIKIHMANFNDAMGRYAEAVAAYLANAPKQEMDQPVWDLLPLLPADTVNPRVEFTNHGKRQMAYFNGAYMNSKLRGDMPQFMVVELRAEGKTADPRFRWRWDLREKFSGGMDFQALGKLIAAD